MVSEGSVSSRPAENLLPRRSGTSAAHTGLMLLRQSLKAKHLKVLLGGVVLLLILVSALVAPLAAPYGPLEQDLSNTLKGPVWLGAMGSKYPLGSDSLGRDVFSRILYGAQVSVVVALGAVTLSAAMGAVLGATSGYFGGLVDYLIMKIVDIFLALPLLLLAIALMAFLGAGIGNLILALAARQWVEYARVVRGEVLSIKERQFVTAARALGAGDARIIFKYILPNTMASIMVVATYAMGVVVLVEASLSFLGLGVPPEIPSWGSMLSSARSYMYQAWWLSFFPGLAIFLMVMAVNFLGDGLRDILDPKMRGA